MTIGDILAVIAAVMLAAASWWATILMAGLLFPAVVGRAEEKLIVAPGMCFGKGVIASLVIGLAALAFSHAAGPFRLISYALLALLAISAAIGSAAVVRVMADRIGGIGSEMTPFARLTRAAALYVGAGFVPIVGWFLILPVAAVGTVGVGIGALRRGNKRSMESSAFGPLAPNPGGTGSEWTKTSLDTPVGDGPNVRVVG